MNSVTHALDAVWAAIAALVDLVLSALGVVELWLRARMAQVGVPHGLQTIVLILVAVLFLVAALRLFGGVLRVLLIVFLLLLALHILAPGLHV